MDDPAFAMPETDLTTQTILLHASQHDLAALKPLLRTPGAASVQDPETGYTALHACIGACSRESSAEELARAKEVVHELFLSGAIWNDLSTAENETPGCLAWRLGLSELYEVCVEAGVRAEMLMNLMGGYEALSSQGEEEDEVEVEVEEEVVVVDVKEGEGEGIGGEAQAQQNGQGGEEIKKDVNSKDYLASDLTFSDDKLLDDDGNGVMMKWETEIMERSVSLLLPSEQEQEQDQDQVQPAQGKRILNIGFGMGIIDKLFAATKPAKHHIIEAHPSVLRVLQAAGPDLGINADPSTTVVHAGRWQDVCQSLLEAGEVYDAIYFDTFGEDYAQLRLFFTELVVGLLDPAGRFGFFNGLGADRRVCYDVYTRVVEMDLVEAGLETEWTTVPVQELGAENQGEWQGVRRRYWTLDEYRLPVCTFLA
ncbi:arginine N-methyltransferase 2 [Phlyctema vagabunda]|uniref:Arginine N-methyltransferase 2 n=1 Tax=Phlyctema vagabunda TaxID=108571 RepID=A0ABR4P256_9HELO